MLDSLRNNYQGSGAAEDDAWINSILQTQTKLATARQFLGDRLSEVDRFDRRATNLSQAIYEEARACRMRPLRDGIQSFPRMVRDLARQLGKEISFHVIGASTQVDRDVLERLDPPLTHLLRNAVDHGIEMPDVRESAGKSRVGSITMEARHLAGMLQIIVSDDGHGINYENLRRKVVRRELTTPEVAEKLSVPELLEFLFLPGFSMRDSVTEISGRGVGLDVVQSMIKSVHGSIRVTSDTGRGIRFQLQLPLTLSVARTLLVEIAEEAYAIPLAHITRTVSVPRNEILLLEGKYHFTHLGQQIGLVWAHQVLGKPPIISEADSLSVALLDYQDKTYGLVVTRFLGERELVIQPLDPRLGKIRNISAGGLLEDGSPALILDTSDVVRSIDKLITGGDLTGFLGNNSTAGLKSLKRVLIVDDSLTVRELERKLLQNAGYAVEVAVDGMDAWNALRTDAFDLVVTDVDMPRLDGVELVKMIKKDTRLSNIPVLIVSYKDREEDRQRGLDAGADYYLAKGSFHDATLIEAVRDLIGEPAS
ncbi:MAG: hybrid sensor histidine kinase/response regulator [Verrucomicrobiales bacterium]